MEMSDGSYSDYARTALAAYEKTPAADRDLLFESVKALNPSRVLDLGCGPGQELTPFARAGAICVKDRSAPATTRVSER